MYARSTSRIRNTFDLMARTPLAKAEWLGVSTIITANRNIEGECNQVNNQEPTGPSLRAVHGLI
jgi:hypothetical protein